MKDKDQSFASDQIVVPTGQIRFVYLPEGDLFALRAKRFRQLSERHSLRDYLLFLALLSDKQQQMLEQFSNLLLPDGALQSRHTAHGLPPLGIRNWIRNPVWHDVLKKILSKMSEEPLPSASLEAIDALMNTHAPELEQMADSILTGDFYHIPPQFLPFVASALQVYWVHMARSMGAHEFGKQDQPGLCPLCGSTPNIGIIKTGGNAEGLRYLCCSLCASQWHMERLKCSICESTKGINYFSLEGMNGAVKAESCDICHSYLKLLYLAQDSQMEAMADDLATLELDMLVDKIGNTRIGPNLFFHPGGIW